MTRRTLLAAALLWLCVNGIAEALPPANNEVTIQPSERRNWVCDYHVPVTTLVAYSVTLRTGADAACPAGAGYVCTPAGLVTEPTVAGDEAAFTITPAGKASGNIYQVTITVEDALGQRFTCDGKVTVRTVKVVL